MAFSELPNDSFADPSEKYLEVLNYDPPPNTDPR